MRGKNKSPEAEHLVEIDVDKLESERTRKHLEQLDGIDEER
jgi:hypothetical protein